MVKWVGVRGEAATHFWTWWILVLWFFNLFLWPYHFPHKLQGGKERSLRREVGGRCGRILRSSFLHLAYSSVVILQVVTLVVLISTQVTRRKREEVGGRCGWRQCGTFLHNCSHPTKPHPTSSAVSCTTTTHTLPRQLYVLVQVTLYVLYFTLMLNTQENTLLWPHLFHFEL